MSVGPTQVLPQVRVGSSSQGGGAQVPPLARAGSLGGRGGPGAGNSGGRGGPGASLRSSASMLGTLIGGEGPGVGQVFFPTPQGALRAALAQERSSNKQVRARLFLRGSGGS